MVISVVSSPARCRSEVTFPAYGCGIRSPSSHADPARPKMSVQVTVTPSLASTPCTCSPAASSTSAAQYHPYVASSTTLGDFPARAITLRSSCGLLVIFAVPRRRPSSVIRTSTLRRRCRSIPTTCRPSYAVSIGASLVWWRRMPCTFQHPPGSGRPAPSSHQPEWLEVPPGRRPWRDQPDYREPAQRVVLITDRRL